MLAQRQPRVDLALDRGEAQLLEPARVRGDEREVGQVGQRVTAPHSQGSAELIPRLGRVAARQPRLSRAHESLEHDRVDRVLVRDQLVSAVDGGQDCPCPSASVRLERLAQVVDVGVDGADVPGRHPLAPQLVGDPRH